jgi:tRNA G18 (ribose-2'-O)-methylase SpoU
MIEMEMERENMQPIETQEGEGKPKLIAGRQLVIEALKSQSVMIEKIYILHGIRGSQIDKIRNLARKRACQSLI